MILFSSNLKRSLFCTLLAGSALLIGPAGVRAESAEKLLAGANRNAGMVLHQEKACMSCHAQRLGGDGSAMYTRLDRKVRTPEKLLTQIAFCNTQLSAAMFPEDERDVAAFLNHDYYHFK